MLFVGLLSWWYSAGLVQAYERVKNWHLAVYDYFSIDILLRSFFSPFRQISAGRVDGPIAVKMRAFFDLQFSRMIGAFMRTIVMCIGIIALLLTVAIGVAYVLVWIIMPAFPLIGLVVTLTGYMPWIR
jgi:hypothetical protein